MCIHTFTVNNYNNFKGSTYRAAYIYMRMHVHLYLYTTVHNYVVEYFILSYTYIEHVQ